MIEFDVETTGLQPWSQRHHAFLYIFDDGETAEAIPFGPDHQENTGRIQAWFDRAAEDDEGIRAWNSKFDRAFAEVAGFIVPGDGHWHDGMLVAHAVNERRSVALKAVGHDLFGDEATDNQKEVKAWLAEERRRRAKEATANGTELIEPNFSDVPWHIILPYALGDGSLTRKISNFYQTTVLDQASDLQGVVDFERKAMDALYAVEKRGLPARTEEYRQLENEVIHNLDALEDKVHALARESDPAVYAKALKKEVEVSEDGSIVSVETGGSLQDFNPNSSPQVLAVLKARGADMSFMSEKKGKLSADAENLRAVDDDFAAAMLEFRSEFKVLSTYVRPMIGRSFDTSIRATKEPFIAPDSRIHANYRQVGARTGRMSCSDPNMQNQPRDDLRLRYNIVADPGYALVACDLSNVEMYLFAAYCGEGRLLEAVRAGDDLHTLTARMLGLRDRKRPGGGIETARQLGKTYNFSRVYGGGLRTIRRSFRCDMNTARLLKKRFDDAYPEVARLQARIRNAIEDNGYVQDRLISGRRYRVSLDEAYKATNYLVQGTAASLLKYAMIKLHEDGVPMVALVHDEIVAHVPQEDAQEVGELIRLRMTEYEGLKGVVPLRADVDIVNRWSDAKPLKEEDGTLYYFDPKWADVPRRYVKEAA